MLELIGTLWALAVIALGLVLSGLTILAWRTWLSGPAGQMFEVFSAIAVALWRHWRNVDSKA